MPIISLVRKKEIYDMPPREREKGKACCLGRGKINPMTRIQFLAKKNMFQIEAFIELCRPHDKALSTQIGQCSMLPQSIDELKSLL